MVLVDDVLVSEELFEERFVCDLNACKGACCVQGESGAPLEKKELKKLDKIWPQVAPYLPKEGRKAIGEKGRWTQNEWDEYETPLVGVNSECAYTVFGEDGMAKCGIELAWQDGKIDWQKPISCHLYPIRVKRLVDMDALNYDRWEICSAACTLGEKLKVPVYQFLKGPLTRKYGEGWYRKLEQVAQSYLQRNK